MGVFGQTLDIRSGYGYFLSFLSSLGLDAVGIEPSEKEFIYSRKWFDVNVKNESIYHTGFQDNEFDTVILRDSIFHLDIDKAISEIKRITSNRCIVLMGNTGLLLKIAKHFLNHEEFQMKKVEEYISAFNSCGFSLKTLDYMDYFAFPLSGGYISRSFIPHDPKLWEKVLKVERIIEKTLQFLKLEKFFSFRALLSFDMQK